MVAFRHARRRASSSGTYPTAGRAGRGARGRGRRPSCGSSGTTSRRPCTAATRSASSSTCSAKRGGAENRASSRRDPRGATTCLATALFGARAGFHVTAALVPQARSDHALRVLRAALDAGARRRPDASNMITVPLVLATRRGADTSSLARGGSSVLGTLPYLEAARELAAQVRARELPEPDLVYVTFGTGAAPRRGSRSASRSSGLATRVVGVSIVEPPALFARMGRPHGEGDRAAPRRDAGGDRRRALAARDRHALARRRLRAAHRSGARGARAGAGGAGVEVDLVYTAKTLAAALARIEAGDVRHLVLTGTRSRPRRSRRCSRGGRPKPSSRRSSRACSDDGCSPRPRGVVRSTPRRSKVMPGGRASAPPPAPECVAGAEAGGAVRAARRDGRVPGRRRRRRAARGAARDADPRRARGGPRGRARRRGAGGALRGGRAAERERALRRRVARVHAARRRRKPARSSGKMADPLVPGDVDVAAHGRGALWVDVTRAGGRAGGHAAFAAVRVGAARAIADRAVVAASCSTPSSRSQRRARWSTTIR